MADAHVSHRDRDAPAPTDLTGLVGYLLRRAQLRISSELAESLSPLGLRPATFSVLVVIDANPGLSQTAVGDLLGIQRANFVNLAAELERMRWIERNPSEEDRRQNALHLSADGRRLLKRAWRIVFEHEAAIARCVGAAGRRELLRLLEALAGADRAWKGISSRNPS